MSRTKRPDACFRGVRTAIMLWRKNVGARKGKQTRMGIAQNGADSIMRRFHTTGNRDGNIGLRILNIAVNETSNILRNTRNTKSYTEPPTKSKEAQHGRNIRQKILRS